MTQTWESRLAAMEHRRTVALEEAAEAWRTLQASPAYLRFLSFDLKARQAEAAIELHHFDRGQPLAAPAPLRRVSAL